MADWDKRYAEAPARLFGDRPNEYLRQVMARSDVTPSSALLLGDGDGRNGLWLAQQGLDVTAVDVSATGTAQALAHDAAAGVGVRRIVADLAEWVPPVGGVYDAVIVLYLQCEDAVRSGAVRRALALLTPGGWFAAEGFSRRGGGKYGAKDGALGPKDPDLLYDLDTFLGVLDGFKIVEAFDGMTHLNEGIKHQGPANVVRVLARREP